MPLQALNNTCQGRKGESSRVTSSTMRAATKCPAIRDTQARPEGRLARQERSTSSRTSTAAPVTKAEKNMASPDVEALRDVEAGRHRHTTDVITHPEDSDTAPLRQQAPPHHNQQQGKKNPENYRDTELTQSKMGQARS
ncbi:hypothetical protein E2C01_030017 [Portunus trituberculatus]|uniref:Uncharacterized protein n=1 Tax=Portunus trituberculatus TaxID=210409 RepID=A0A5B7EUI8_PORTR|nr:hypothetical protein [Portunus trituberculatus]